MKKIVLFLTLLFAILMFAFLKIFTDYFDHRKILQINKEYLVLNSEEDDNYNFMSTKYGGYSLVIPNLITLYENKKEEFIAISPEDSNSFLNYNPLDSQQKKGNEHHYYLINSKGIVSEIDEGKFKDSIKNFKSIWIKPQ